MRTSTTLLSFCSQLLFLFNLLFESPIPIVLSIVIHHDTLNKLVFSKNFQFVKDISFPYSLFFLDDLFTKLSFKFVFLQLLNSYFLLFWSVFSFNQSYCLVLSCANLEFVRYFFSKTSLDYAKITFLSFTFTICFCLP